MPKNKKEDILTKRTVETPAAKEPEKKKISYTVISAKKPKSDTAVNETVHSDSQINIKQNKKKDDSINSNPVPADRNRRVSVDKKKQNIKSDSVTEQKGTQNTEQKSDGTVTDTGKNRKVSSKAGSGNKENGNTDPAKSKSVTGRSAKSRNKSDSSKSSAAVKVGKRSKSKSAETSEQYDENDFGVKTYGKAVRRRKRDTKRYETIMGPVALTDKPKPVIDEPWLVEIEIDGEPKQVSSWSIRDGRYIQGLDSEFLVHNYFTVKKPTKYNG